jgi:hypothetical protein
MESPNKGYNPCPPPKPSAANPKAPPATEMKRNPNMGKAYPSSKSGRVPHRAYSAFSVFLFFLPQLIPAPNGPPERRGATHDADAEPAP